MFQKQILNPLLYHLAFSKENTAFFINEKNFTYHDLAQCISKIRTKLQQDKSTSKLIGLVTNDDLETYASVFAIWLEGKAYVPVHQSFPIDRCKNIFEQTQLQLLLDSSEESRFSEVSPKIMNTSLLLFSELNLEPTPTDEQEIAYILFTSGSTGEPKGVVLSRENIAALIDSFWDSGITLTSSDRFVQCFELTFDVSIHAFLAPLMKGASVYTIPTNKIKYTYVSYLLEEHGITMGSFAPSMIRYLKPYFEEMSAPTLKHCILTAEPVQYELCKEFQACIPNARIWDFYGPTEVTIWCTYCEVTHQSKTLNGMLGIGKSMKNVHTVVIDEQLHQVENGTKGELCFSGKQVCLGYLNNPEKNKEAFIEIEVNGKNERYYRSGDLGYIDQDEEIMILGRMDSQVKIQGYRIEIGEIEHHVRNIVSNNAFITAFTNKNGNTELALFLEGETDIELLKSELKNKIAAYMMPSKYFLEAQFPLNNSSKVDKIALKKQHLKD